MKFVKVSVKRWSKYHLIAIHDILYIEAQGFRRSKITFRNLLVLPDVMATPAEMETKIADALKA